MGRLSSVLVIVTLSSVVAASTASRAQANACPYRISVSREGLPGEQTARVCDVDRIADWLGAVPDATASTQAPKGALHASFTVTVVAASGSSRNGASPNPPQGRVLLKERVYPRAESGPVAFVPSRSVFQHHPGPFPKWVVSVGWRALDASKGVPPVLARLGMPQPTSDGTTPTLIPTPTAPTSAANPPRPDLVTLFFVAAVLVLVGAVVRRTKARTHPHPQGDHSEFSNHG
jgi:hypothetical protein